jgi:two-component system, cell cycle sensor histidine kinase and response regulator CckA
MRQPSSGKSRRGQASPLFPNTPAILESIVSSLTDGVLVANQAGRLLLFNNAVERLIDTALPEAPPPEWPKRYGFYLPDQTTPFPPAEFPLARAIRGERAESVETFVRNGRAPEGLWVSVSATPLQHAAGRWRGGVLVLRDVTGATSMIADVTERKRLEDEVRQAQKMEAVGRLAGGVAHDFNNLLTVIAGYTQMLLDGLEEEHPMRSYVEEIVRAGESATALTNQLLAFSRRQIVTPRVLDLNSLVSGMRGLLHRLLGEDVELIPELAPGLPRVRVDEGQFQQVLMNLAANARDAMPEGGTIMLRTSVEAVAAPRRDAVTPGNYVVLSVTDSGKGMSEETRRGIFEPFFTTKGRGKGTGLGLSTVYGIVKQAGGEVTAEAEPGAGTTFRIYLPAIERAAAAGVESPSVPERRKGTETVLLVEDEGGLRKLVCEVLQNDGYTVLPAANFDEAVSLCETHTGSIHLCLTDMILPGTSGLELGSRVVQLRPRLKVLYMSGHTDHALFDRAPWGSGTQFLRKPFTPESLLAKVREALDS